MIHLAMRKMKLPSYCESLKRSSASVRSKKRRRFVEFERIDAGGLTADRRCRNVRKPQKSKAKGKRILL